MSLSPRTRPARTEGLRCISRVFIGESKTRGWQVRVIRRGKAVHEFFSDGKHGGKAGALSEAMHFRDKVVRKLRPYSRAELAKRVTARNSSGTPGVRRRLKSVTRQGKVHQYEVWSASGSPQPNQRKTRDFYVSKLGEDGAREAALAQRARWERQMVRNEKKAQLPPA